MDLEKILSADRSKGDTPCVICETKISKGEKVIAAEVKIGSSFITALQKTLRKEIHVQCAKSSLALLVRIVVAAEGL